MKKLLYFVIFFVYAVSGLAYAADPVTKPVKQSVSQSVDCPSLVFPEFLNAFSENIDIQKAFTRYPLEDEYIDAIAEPEPKEVFRKLMRHQVEFPVFINKSEREAESLKMQIDKQASNKYTVIIWKEDTDYKIYYYFIKDSCWKLVRIYNASL